MSRNWAWFGLNFVFGIQLILLAHEIIQENFSWIWFALALTLVLMLNYHIYSERHDAVHAVSDEKLCPCGHEHKPRSDGRGLRTYCVKGSQCNSDKCKEFVSVATDEGGEDGS